MADAQIPPWKIPNIKQEQHIFFSEYPLISTTALDQITRNRQKNVLGRTKKRHIFVFMTLHSKQGIIIKNIRYAPHTLWKLTKKVNDRTTKLSNEIARINKNNNNKNQKKKEKTERNAIQMHVSFENKGFSCAGGNDFHKIASTVRIDPMGDPRSRK